MKGRPVMQEAFAPRPRAETRGRAAAAPGGPPLPARSPVPLPAEEMRLDEGLPAHVGALYVSDAVKPGEYRLRGWHGADHFDIPGARPPEELTGGDLTPRQLYDLMTVFSDEVNPARQWVARARAAREDDFTLILADHTRTNIPWEMLRLVNTENRFLGDQVTVIRWGLIDGEAGEPVPLSTDRRECAGGVAAYVDPKEWKAHSPQLAMFAEDGDRHHDLTAFMARLAERGRPACSVVYFFCHATVSDDALEMKLHTQDNKQSLKYATFLRTNLAPFRAAPPVVFLNACGSGRGVRYEGVLNGSGRRSFAEKFLGKGAWGVIATLDSVRAKFAARVSREFFEAHQGAAHESAARLLRRVREAAATELGDGPEPANETLERWFYTYLYVYFGHLEAVLRLTRKGGGP